MISEEIDRKDVALAGSLPITAVDACIERAAEKGIVFVPLSRIRRDPDVSGRSLHAGKPFFVSPTLPSNGTSRRSATSIAGTAMTARIGALLR